MLDHPYLKTAMLGILNLTKFNVTIFSLCIFSGLLLSCSASQSSKLIEVQPVSQEVIIKSPNDNRVYDSIVLDNQLEIILVSDPSIEKSAAALSVGAGSFQEPTEFPGLAHYLEHMLFMGTKSYPEVNGYSEFVSRNGGVQNAYTELDHTNYMVAVNNAAFEEVLSRFSGFFYEAKLDPEYADKERNAVHSEWSMKSPNDWVILEQLNGLTLNSAHPISRFSWGNLDSLVDQKGQSLHAALQQFYETYYSANLMKASLISHLPIQQMKVLAKKYFAKIPNKQTVIPVLDVAVAKPSHLSKIIHYAPQTDMRQIQIKFVMENNAAQFAVKPNGYVEYLLSNEMPGTLAAVLREQGLSEAVYASYQGDKYANAGDFSLYIDLTESGVNNRDQVMAVVMGYLRLLREKGVDEKYFNEIRQSLHNSFRFKEKANDYDYAMQIAANLQLVPTAYVLSSAYEYQRFNAAAIERVLTQLRLTNARIFYIDKQQPINTKMQYFVGQYAVSDITEAQLDTWQQLANEYTLNLPRANSLMPENFNLVPARYTGKPKSLVSQPGFNLYLGHSALFSEPKGLFFVELNTGLAKKNPRNHVLSNILGRVLEQQSTELQSEAYIAGMGLNVAINNGISISLSGFTQRQGTLLDKVLDKISTLEVTQADLKNYIADFKSDIESAKSQVLLDQLFPKYRKVLNLDNYSDGDLLNEAQNISIDELLAFKNALLKKANLRIFAFGNYQQNEAIQMADQVLATLPKDRDFSGFYLSPELNAAAGRVYDWRENINMTDVAFVDTYMAPFDIYDFAVLQILSQFIQSALFKQIRTEEQLAYALGFFSQKINQQVLFGYYIQSPVAGLANTYQRIKLFNAGFTEQLQELSAQEFNTVKVSVLSKLLEPAKHLNAEVADLLNDWRTNNLNFDSKSQLIKALKNVRHEDLLSFYKKMQSNKYFGRLIIQLRGANFGHEPFISIENASPVQDVDLLHKEHLKHRLHKF